MIRPLTNLNELERTLGDKLKRIESAVFVLRAFRVRSFLRVDDARKMRRFRESLREMRAEMPSRPVPSTIEIVTSRNKRARRTALGDLWKNTDCHEQVLDYIGKCWQEIRDDFEEEFYPRVPRIFINHLPGERAFFWSLWSIPFFLKPGKTLDPGEVSMKFELAEKGFWPAITWRQFCTFWTDRRFSVQWPNYGRMRKQIARTCRALAGRPNLSPTDQEVISAAIAIVNAHSQDHFRSRDEQALNELFGKELEVPTMLAADALIREIADRFVPCKVGVDRIGRLLLELVDRGLLRRVRFAGEGYYLLPMRVTHPRWDAETRTLLFGNAVCKDFRKHPSPGQIRILQEFEELKWPRSLDDPLPPRPKVNSKRRLGKIVEGLNRRLKIIRFRLIGTGSQVAWDAAKEL